MALFSKTKTSSNDSTNVVFDFLKGLIVATLISLGLVILLAFCINWFEIKDSYLSPLTLLIKGISIVVGTVIAVRGESKGLLKGMCFGIIYIVFAFVIFSILSSSFKLGLSSLLNVLFASLLGGIVGIIKVNKK